MRIAVCDDDEMELTRLSRLIGEYQTGHGADPVCRLYHNGTDFLCDLKAEQFDLVFLDILMPGVSGVQVAQELRETDKNVKIVFISSSPEFALESYNVGAYHYLIKPVEGGSLFPLLDRAESELSGREGRGFVLRNRKGIVWISYANLEYVEVINKKVFLHMADGVIHEATTALAEYEGKLLGRPEFLKIHRSYLINLRYVREIGSNCVLTGNGHSIPIARQRRNDVQEAYMRFVNRTEADSVFQAQTAVFQQQKRTDGPWRILLVDDDAGERGFWAGILRFHGCVVQCAGNGAEALALAAQESFDCVLLDVMIPGENGFSICENLMVQTRAPIIFLSCLTEPDRQLEGFAAGGIDYITKDTPPELFWAKVETRIRLAQCDRTQFRYGPLLLDLSGRRALMDGRELSLTSVEFDLLWRLSEQAEHIFSMEEIFDLIWSGQPWDGGQTVQVHMSRLRRKLERAWEKHHFIETVWGQGYRFVPVTD